MPTLSHQTIWLPALARENFYIEGFTFEDCALLGPLVLAPRDNVTIENCTFDGVNPQAVLITAPEGAILHYAVGLRDVALRRCQLRRLALIGTAQDVARWLAGIAFVPQS